MNTSKSPAGGKLRLLAVHAHPDDEASKGAAMMASYAAAGVEGDLTRYVDKAADPHERDIVGDRGDRLREGDPLRGQAFFDL